MRSILHKRTCFYIKRTITINVRNSLVQSPVFQINENRPITWYSCGPTVYDVAHLGHARTYVCTDIIRRILINYFRVPVDYALGITDIDDKIIDRTRALIQSDSTQDASSNIDSITMNTAFVKLARHFEDEFFKDMDDLNVLRPNAVLRVSEHIDEIIGYIRGIEQRGLAYATSDGVYFDVGAYGMDRYGKLGNTNTVENTVSEPDINNSIVGRSNKRSSRDFALWKSSKPGEPSWPSPWGLGRPGWHIECSAMTHAYFGPTFDVHSGGIDLKFPHHTNEIAQCEAHNDANHWVNLWIHFGHLHIDGLKMSKSLKNFISIRQYLTGSYSSNPAVDFRLFCLLFKYDNSINFSSDRINEATVIRQKLENFFSTFKSLQRLNIKSDDTSGQPYNLLDPLSASEKSSHKKMTPETRILLKLLLETQTNVSMALQDDFDTPLAMKHLITLANDTFQYTSKLLTSANDVAILSSPIEPLLAIATYLQQMLEIFGVQLINFGGENNDGSTNVGCGNTISSDDYMATLAEFRTKVRSSSLTAMKTSKKAKKATDLEEAQVHLKEMTQQIDDILKSCDDLRDKVCPEKLKMKLEDLGDKSTWKPIV